ncbi:hypothetical protein [Vibrio nitrifigilis]|uniref:Uncharacterized protein n=1 Tax=Vibrio nitrifigilis TaxID=2789781 RepID=A0ABS0GLN8_9VIBR|nr:hypothetical protein [Vibrio nitrifigilis]MBF9003371.1 hypothetical protein [Vibrio nitrifigilis]
MKNLTVALSLAAITSGFATAANAADLTPHVFTIHNQATITLTENGRSVAGYPIQVVGADKATNEINDHTAKQGSLTVINRSNQPETITFIVNSKKDGQPIVIKRTLGRES